MTESDDELTMADVLRRVPDRNRATVTRILEHVAVSRFHATELYVRADRSDGAPSLRIASGWVNGFADRDEAIAAGGQGLEVWPSGERAPLWGLWMPDNRRHDAAAVGPRRAEQQACATCGDLMPLTNVCDHCA